ncbi:MAG: DNA mismatch repair protein MutS [Lachnospiraceae bacterium]|nr:DNA mismatch repair protein MutS [Lachnospiraceae bacterium]
MMRHYMEMKALYPDCILFYRLGDFYEMFFDDALIVSKALELTLTGKACGLKERAPMCGVPFHSAETYLNRLVSLGHKVAICEQVEDPAQAKGIVKRDVIRVVTPGTNLNISSLHSDENNFLLCVYDSAEGAGIAYADVTTGAFFLTQCDTSTSVFDEVMRAAPKELICNDAFLMRLNANPVAKERLQCPAQALKPHDFDDHNAREVLKKQFHILHLDGLGIESFSLGILAAGALLNYLKETQKAELKNITHVTPYVSGHFMLLDTSTRRNLELTETMREKEKRGSLFWVLDKTKTAMGARTLRRMIEQPLIDKEAIEMRLNAVEALMTHSIVLDELREYLTPVYDFERLMGKIIYQTATPRDLLAFSASVKMLPALRIALSDLTEDKELFRLIKQMDPLQDLYALITNAISEDAPLAVKEGKIIKSGYHKDIDRYREADTKGKQWIAELEESERERTGIKTLRIKFSNNFGYSFEVTNSLLDKVPKDFIRKQTLTNCERFTTPRLKELEDEILNAQDKLNRLEYECFCMVRDAIAAEVKRILETANAVALLDVYASLAFVAEKNHYVKPEITTNGSIKIKGGRHPVVEQMMTGTNSAQMFIENDAFLDNAKHQIAIITGPNMAGKSTYMRQCALIVLMAQMGSFVPAQSASVSLCDRIFTRVGASDDLASGQSTFMVEMNEVANILRNATKDSLLILDEIGRGTSTYDGLSIAWAVIEHIANRNYLGAKTLFATHYHELTELEGKIDNVINYCIAVKENGDDIVFLRKIIKGGADKSYGIQVAHLAGVPEIVIDRAKELLGELTDSDITSHIAKIEVKNVDAAKQKTKNAVPDEVDLNQMTLMDTATDEDVLKELKEIDIQSMTPLDALNTLYRLQGKIKNRW